MDNTLKLVTLQAACDAQDAIDPLGDAADAAQRALLAEQLLADELEARFYEEYNDDERDSGICNARDTANQYSLYENFGSKVERSTEFWQLAIDTAQYMRDCK